MANNGEQLEGLSVPARNTAKGAFLGALGFGEMLTGFVVHDGGALEILGFVTLAAASGVLLSREGYDQQPTQHNELATD